MELPPQYIQDAICRMQECRGWIISSFAQIEYLLGDLVFRSVSMPEYAHLGNDQPTKMYKLLGRFKAILEVDDGYFSKFREDLGSSLAFLEENLDQRHLLAHGHMTVFHDADSNIQYRFRKWHREHGLICEKVHDCFPVHIEYQATQLREISSRISSVSRNIHHDLGLIGS